MTVYFMEGPAGGVTNPCLSLNSGTTVNIVTSKYAAGGPGYSINFNPGLGSGNIPYVQYKKLSADGSTTVDMAIAINTPTYLQFYFLYTAGGLPTSGSDSLLVGYKNTTGGNLRQMTVGVNSSGKLTVRFAYDISTNVAASATGSTAMVDGQWYRIAILHTNGTSAAWEIRLNGATELSGTATQGANTLDMIEFGPHSRGNNGVVDTAGLDWYIRDIIFQDTGWPSEGQVKLSRPKGNGSTQDWASGTGSTFAEVDDLDFQTAADGGATYVKNTTVANKVALFNMQDCADIGIAVGSTINAVMSLVSIREDSSVTSSNKLRVRSASTNFDNTALNHGVAYTLKARIDANDPGTGVAWTMAGFDAFEIGSIEVNAVAMRMDVAYCLVHVTPPVGDQSHGMFALLQN